MRPFVINTTAAPHYRRFILQRKSAMAERRHDRPPSRFTSLNVNDGKGVMFVSHTGAIYPSGFMPIPCGRFPAQNVVNVYQQSPLFRALREVASLEGKCARCEYRKACGGSRARAFAVTGDPFAEEPDCSYRPRQTATPTS
jgi:radical SAM protein with 4Fe4S-binding SPASM domain